MLYGEAQSRIEKVGVKPGHDWSNYYEVQVLPCLSKKSGDKEQEEIEVKQEETEIGDICGVVGRGKFFDERGWFVEYDDLYVVWKDYQDNCIHRAKLYSTLTPFPEGEFTKYSIEFKKRILVIGITVNTVVEGLFLEHTFRIPFSITNK